MSQPKHSKLRIVERKGPLFFETRRVLTDEHGRRIVQHSRHNRKQFRFHTPEKGKSVKAVLHVSAWTTPDLNWWIGTLFAVGSVFFAVASYFYLAPAHARYLGLSDSVLNELYFIGSIPFTMAGYLQLYQAANAGDFNTPDLVKPTRRAFLGWRPQDIGWLSSAVQFAGTLLFNVNTFDAMTPGLTWVQQDLQIWIPNFVGSTFFLISGYLAFMEVANGYLSLEVVSISWWITFINLLGCIAFMISAVFAFVPSHPFSFDAASISIFFTLVGAICFFWGSLLMLPEAGPTKSGSDAAEAV